MNGSGADPEDPFADEIAAKLASRAQPTGGSPSRGRSAVDGPIEIGPDEVDVVALFLALGTQWRRHPFTGAVTGIDYVSVPPTAALSGIATGPALFADLREMETAALAAVSAASAR